MPSISFSGSILVAPGTPRNIGTITATGNYQLHLDTGQMVDGDELESRIGEQVAAGGTLSLMYDGMWADRQATQIKISEPFSVLRAAQLHLTATAGGARWFAYDVVLI